MMNTENLWFDSEYSEKNGLSAPFDAEILKGFVNASLDCVKDAERRVQEAKEAEKQAKLEAKEQEKRNKELLKEAEKIVAKAKKEEEKALKAAEKAAEKENKATSEEEAA